ncbi:hypothetical protein JOH51_006538 [Rhizobium leguminosarum]|nr:hypothetical protein [Rhizobium leguminosarum]
MHQFLVFAGRIYPVFESLLVGKVPGGKYQSNETLFGKAHPDR